ncbi:MAG: SagB family peptide dehydrogenase [Candidatus Hodarchaeales archaeon]|jgi:SagB-type dehydrogenase family enzyme
MGKKSKTKQQLKFIFLLMILISSLILLILEMFPTSSDRIHLPTPDYKGHLPLSTTIHQSKPSQDLRNYIIQNKSVSQLMWALQGETHGPRFRTVPSAGATYPLEIFIVSNGTHALRKGYYNYVPQGHQLRCVSSSYNWTLLLSALFGEDREAVSNVSTIFFILADYARTTFKYHDRGFQYVHLEVGHAIQNFLLQLVSLNLNTRMIANFTSHRIQNFLNTTLEPMVVLPVGISGDSDSPVIKLKQLSSSNTEEMTVEEAIAKRESVRDYLSGKIPLSIILDVLEDSTTIPHIVGNNSQLDLRLVANDIDGLPIGSYKYFLENNSLYQLSQGDLRSSITDTYKISGQQCVVSAQLDVFISVDTSWINQQVDYSLYHRIMMFNVGLIAQNIYLKCAANGLGTVVIGAFSGSGSAMLLDIPDTHTPIYLIPIGLTPYFFEEPTDFQLPLSEIARIIALLLYVLFFISLYLSLPILRRRITKKMRWFHCIFGIITLIGGIFHYMVIHGHVHNLWGFLSVNSYLNALIYFLNNIFSFPMTRYDVGMVMAYLTVCLGTVVVITGIAFAFKLGKQRKSVRTIHKYIIYFTLGSAIIHNFLNGVIFSTEPLIFLLLNILAIDLYFILFLSPDFVKTVQKKEISYQ